MHQDEFYRHEGGEFLEEQTQVKQFPWRKVILAAVTLFALIAFASFGFDFSHTPV